MNAATITLLLLPCWTAAFLAVTPLHPCATHMFGIAPIARQMAYGDFTVELEKPLGIILEERDEGKKRGVRVESVVEGGNAAEDGSIVPGDVLLRVGDTDVAEYDFDSVMDLLSSAPPSIRLTLGDGLGMMDIAPNLAKQLSPDAAVLTDGTVRAAVREIRGNRRARVSLGDLLRVEIVLGAGVRGKGSRCAVRFFAIFSTDNITSYSCNVSATGVRKSDGGIAIVALSCAKDEGWGQTIDLIREEE